MSWGTSPAAAPSAGWPACSSSRCRTTDTAARYGGDEFVVVLADTDLQGAELVSSRTHELLADDTDVPRLSVSAGIAVYPADGQHADNTA